MAGCTFEEASDPAVPCEYSQAQYDDFQWEQVRVHPGTRAPADLPHGSYLMVNASQHAPGQRAHVIFQSLSENDTHCVQFSYFLYSRDGHSPGTLGIYVRVNGGPLGSAVWNMTGSHGRQWHQAELAVSTFWPNEYQVLFEALISSDRRGYMGLDDILLLSYPCEPPTPIAPPQLLRAGPTYLIIQLNTNSIIGDGPIVQPMRAPKGLAFAEIQARQLTLQWEPLGYNVTRCHTYTVSLCYHYTLGSSHNQTIRECVKIEQGVSRYTIKNLLPYRNVHVRLVLTNPEGRKEGKEVTFQTDEDAPSFDYADMPSPLGESENTITVLLRPAQGRGAPISVYQVIVEEERPRRLRREPGGQDCFPVPLTFDAALARGLVHYFGAELAASSLPEAMPFTVAACKESKQPLEVSQRSEEMGLILGICAGGLAVLILLLGAIIIIIRKGLPWTLLPLIPEESSWAHDSEETSFLPVPSPGPQRKPVNMTKATVNYRQEKTHMMSAVDRSFTDQSTLQEDERLGLSFMDGHGYSPRGECPALPRGPQWRPEFCGLEQKAMLILMGFRLWAGARVYQKPLSLSLTTGDQRSGGVTEASSLLGGSPRRPCGRKGSPYHTGQLHPAVRVADLLQHINQMKTAEGYGFKQEYESFFEGWDATKKKDKVKGGRQEPMPAYDRHRVKLHPMLGDPDADYINANYIDGYHRSNHFIATQGPNGHELAVGGVCVG
ncbi:hypothetical protein E2I00_011262 [Balaenoptera physalus]|uniref:Protein-tyrosine-phosphatase n=1 Tax=Balaenoptera physalus TaxID=9770 RepID=A0A643CJS7_BALPH|nr:hypothetical protein E2I00_011262 [Balaenoptera physalus]